MKEDRMTSERPLTILCLASYEKGADFMRECHDHGGRVLLLTHNNLADAAWPHDAIDNIFYMPDMYNRQDVLYGVSYLARTTQIDRIVALDDFDVETAAALREHLRVPGMGDTTARYFRDKLAMRVKAQDEKINVPPFVPVINYDQVRQFLAQTAPPWVLKPRSEASSVGIKKLHSAQELWNALDLLGDRQSFYVLEQYIKGDVYHVDAIVSERKVVFAQASRYNTPPLDLSQNGGVSISRTLPRESADAKALRKLNRKLLKKMRFVRGVTHTEFIKGDDGAWYFLETSARVGGANLAEMIEAASGVNLWREWAKIEIAGGKEPYTPPEPREEYAGIIVSLARQEWSDTAAYDDPEVVWRLHKRHHAGLVVASPDAERVDGLLHSYASRFAEDFLAVQPAPDKPSS